MEIGKNKSKFFHELSIVKLILQIFLDHFTFINHLNM
jgi:hypothetical protein